MDIAVTAVGAEAARATGIAITDAADYLGTPRDKSILSVAGGTCHHSR